MFPEESRWIRRKLLMLENIKNAADVGSSTLKYRKIAQPFIEENIYSFFSENDINLSCMDIKKDEGVDIICDICNNKFVLNNKFDLVICSNLLEHLTNIDLAIDNISNMVNNNGYLIVTSPYIYPFHADPIDNMFRPNIQDLKDLFEKFDIVDAEIINIESQKLFGKFSFSRSIRTVIYMLIKRKMEHLVENYRYHFFRKPRSTCVLFKKK